MSQQDLDAALKELQRRAQEQLKQIESARTAPISQQTVPTAQPAGDRLDFGVSPDPFGPGGMAATTPMFPESPDYANPQGILGMMLSPLAMYDETLNVLGGLATTGIQGALVPGEQEAERIAREEREMGVGTIMAAYKAFERFNPPIVGRVAPFRAIGMQTPPILRDIVPGFDINARHLIEFGVDPANLIGIGLPGAI